MGAIISLLIVIAVSFVVVRVGTNALIMTGLAHDVASFQACSAFFGVGFTTHEAELVVSDPARRRVIKHLIIIGNIGLTAGAGSIIVAFVKAGDPGEELRVLLFIVLGSVGLLLLALLPPVRAFIDSMIRASLRHSGVSQPADFALLLRVASGYVVEEVHIDAAHPLVGRSLKDLRLGSQGVVVLGATRQSPGGKDEYFGAPSGDFSLERGDRLIVYGQIKKIAELLKVSSITGSSSLPV